MEIKLKHCDIIDFFQKQKQMQVASSGKKKLLEL
jgi:hypothetical protein